MKKHNCENYRHTEMKYQKLELPEGERVDFDKPLLLSFCSLCGKLLRRVGVVY